MELPLHLSIAWLCQKRWQNQKNILKCFRTYVSSVEEDLGDSFLKLALPKYLKGMYIINHHERFKNYYTLC